MSDDLTYLYKAARAATKGNWHSVGTWVENESDNLADICLCDTAHFSQGHLSTDKQNCMNAKFIAAANPKTVQSLIHTIRALRKQVRIYQNGK